jgi:hypothetical protein
LQPGLLRTPSFDCHRHPGRVHARSTRRKQLGLLPTSPHALPPLAAFKRPCATLDRNLCRCHPLRVSCERTKTHARFASNVFKAAPARPPELKSNCRDREEKVERLRVPAIRRINCRPSFNAAARERAYARIHPFCQSRSCRSERDLYLSSCSNGSDETGFETVSSRLDTSAISFAVFAAMGISGTCGSRTCGSSNRLERSDRCHRTRHRVVLFPI